MKMHKYKKQSLVVLLIALITAPIFFYSKDNLLRKELKRLYSAEFENCKITKVAEREYSGNGYYYVFFVDKNSEHFPVLLTTSNVNDYELFHVGAIINKRKNSFDILLTVDNKEYKLKSRQPKDEYDKASVFIPIFAFGFIFLILLFVPNSVFEFLGQGRKF